MNPLRNIAGVFILVGAVFGVPVVTALLAGKLGLPARVFGWAALAAMFVLLFYVFTEERCGRKPVIKFKINPWWPVPPP